MSLKALLPAKFVWILIFQCFWFQGHLPFGALPCHRCWLHLHHSLNVVPCVKTKLEEIHQLSIMYHNILRGPTPPRQIWTRSPISILSKSILRILPSSTFQPLRAGCPKIHQAYPHHMIKGVTFPASHFPPWGPSCHINMRLTGFPRLGLSE